MAFNPIFRQPEEHLPIGRAVPGMEAAEDAVQFSDIVSDSAFGHHIAIDSVSGPPAALKSRLASPIQMMRFASEGMRHVPACVFSFMGSLEHHCMDCLNALASTCRDMHHGTLPQWK